MAENSGETPDALLLVGSGCPHCATLLQTLGELVKRGEIAHLEVINVTRRPEVAMAHGVRSVPWLRLGPFELQGLLSAEELRQWLARAGTREGMTAYFSELLLSGRLDQAIALLRRDPAQFAALLEPLADADSELQVRIGIGAVLEDFAGDPALAAQLPRLCELSRHADPRIRLDACHYLGLSSAPEAADCLRARLEDDDAEVREEAGEMLAALMTGDISGSDAETPD